MTNVEVRDMRAPEITSARILPGDVRAHVAWLGRMTGADTRCPARAGSEYIIGKLDRLVLVVQVIPCMKVVQGVPHFGCK